MKIKVQKYGDIKVGDGWLGETVNMTTYNGGHVLLSGGGDMSPLAVQTVIDAGHNEVERKPEKVVFTMKVEQRGSFLTHAHADIIELDPGLYTVEVTPE